jgi:hypothetical protein
VLRFLGKGARPPRIGRIIMAIQRNFDAGCAGLDATTPVERVTSLAPHAPLPEDAR